MNIELVQKLIAAADKVSQVPLISSKHGIGKSSICAAYANENNLHFEPLILSLMDTGDLMGIPNTTMIGGQKTTTWAAPDWYSRIINAAWPIEMPVARLEFTAPELESVVVESATDGMVSREDLNRMYCKHYNMSSDELRLLRQSDVRYKDAKRSVLFLDEFNRAPSDILNASLQLILDKRLHSHVLPLVDGKETCLIAAINPADGAYTVAEFDPALLDRFVPCDLDPDTKAWLSWANKEDLNQVVRDYLTENPSKIHYVPKGASKKGASPRSWAAVAKYLDSINDTPDEVTSYYLKGLIGDTLAAEFLLYLNGYVRSMSVETLEELAKKKPKIDIESLGEYLAEQTKELESTKRLELAENLYKKYKDVKDHKKARAYLGFLYALPAENLAGYLSSIKQGDTEALNHLVGLDKDANNKNLFRRIVSKIEND